MNTRAVAVLVAVVVLVAGGTWWVLQRDAGEIEAEPAEPGTSETSEPDEPQSTEPPEPEGRPVAACAEDVPGEIPDAYWGMHLADPVGTEFPEAPITTVNLTTAGTYWNQVETAPGSYELSRLDDIVATAEDRGARPMVVLGFTPSFHAKQPDSPTARATMPDLTAWRSWVTTLVERYGDRLDYQVWPEPNIVSNWTGTPQQMARLTAIAGEIIHDRAPDALVTAPATALRLESQQQWMDRFWATEVEGVPVADHVDAVALDPFPLEEGTPEDALDLICRAGEILADHGVDLPLWTNEINYGVPSGGGATDVQHYPDPLQAAMVVRTYVLHAALGVDRVYWLGWFSSPGMAVELARNGETTPAGEAFGVVREWLEGTPRPTCRVDEGVHTCVVDGRADDLTILWRERGTAQVRAPDGATLVETVTGESRRISAGDALRVGQSPVAVVTSD